MRFNEILLEYDAELSHERWGDKIMDSAKNDGTIINYTPGSYGDDELEKFKIVRHLLYQFEQSDPTPNNKYVPWIIKMYTQAKGQLKLEDINTTLSDALENYSKLVTGKKMPLDYRDINKIKSSDNLYDIVDKFKKYLPVEKNEDRGEYDIFFDNEDVKIIIPKDAAAARFWGRGTRWCTSSKKNYDLVFDQYSNELSALVIIIPKKPIYTGEKYQTQGRRSYIDHSFGQPKIAPESIVNEKDRPLTPQEIINLQKRLRLDLALSPEKFEQEYAVSSYEDDRKVSTYLDLYSDPPVWMFSSPKELSRMYRNPDRKIRWQGRWHADELEGNK